MKKIAILGSTGSIGTQTLEIVREQKDICVRALAAGNNIDLLEQQIREFHPVLASVQSEEKAADLRQRLRDMDIKIVSGMDGLIEVATEPQAEILVTAVVGMLGLRPTVEAIKAKKTIALANKETLVTAGHLIMPLAKECGVPILPVDSEHSAIFQSLNGERQNRIAKILLTASGGPFRGKKREELRAGYLRGCLEASELEHGQKNHGRFGDPCKQRAGGHGSKVAVWCGIRTDSGGRASAERHSFDGGIRGRCSDCTAWYTGYASADPVCTLLSEPKKFKRKAFEFLRIGKSDL